MIGSLGLRSSIKARSTKTLIERKKTPRWKHGRRFGTKVASPDGEKIFQASTWDIRKVIKKKGILPEEINDLYDRGILTKWLKIPKNRHIVPYDPVTKWDRFTSRRTGVLGVKIGMGIETDLWGINHPVTMVQMRENHVIQVKKDDKNNYRLQVGAGLEKLKRVNKAMMGHYANANVPPKEKIAEFKVSEDAVIPAGTRIYPRHFTVGQYVDVKGQSHGKGFQGVVKRFGFAGGPASHGASKFHRRPGSIGQCQDPGRVWKGKKMPGRQGGNTVRTLKLKIVKINTVDEILFIRGSIPGKAGSWVMITDSFIKKHNLPPPFPTYQPPEGSEKAATKKKYLRMKYFDPFFSDRSVDWIAKWQEARKNLKIGSLDDE